MIKLQNNEVNYSAIVCRVHNLLDLEGLDNLKGFPFQGTQCLVGKDVKVGDMGIIFPAECQLSKDFCKENNLYRHSELNKDPEQTGYIEDSRRVKAIKFRGNISTALFMPISSLKYLGVNLDDLNEGDSFTSINNTEVCRKYIIKEYKSATNKTRGQTKKFTRITNKTFPEHWDTDNYWRNAGFYKPYEEIIVTQKLHGCVHEDTLVDTTKGIKKIKEVVENRLDCQILAHNFETGQDEYCDIGEYFLKENDGEWYEITLEDGRTITITGNNPVWLPEIGCYRRVDELIENDVVSVI